MPETSFPTATPEQISEGKGIGVLSYLWWLCIVPLVSQPDNPFSQYHARQGIVLAALQTIILVISIIFTSIGNWWSWLIYLWIIGIIFWFAYVASWVLGIIGIINVSQGKFWKMPVLGDLAESIFKSKS